MYIYIYISLSLSVVHWTAALIHFGWFVASARDPFLTAWNCNFGARPRETNWSHHVTSCKKCYHLKTVVPPRSEFHQGRCNSVHQYLGHRGFNQRATKASWYILAGLACWTVNEECWFSMQSAKTCLASWMDHIPEHMGMLKVKADQGSHKASEGVDFRHGLLRVSHWHPDLFSRSMRFCDGQGFASHPFLSKARLAADLYSHTRTAGQCRAGHNGFNKVWRDLIGRMSTPNATRYIIIVW